MQEKKDLVEVVQKGLLRKCYLVFEKVSSIIPDKTYLKIVYRIRLGKKLNLDNPTTLSEKLQWLKIYNRQPIYTDMVDKVTVKKYVSERIGSEHVVPLLGVWDNFDEIDFDKLPDQFILKCSHDSGSFAVCKDKASFDRDAARKMFKSALKRNYFWGGREWPYKNVPRKILAEQYIESLGNPYSVEYKLTCFNGRVEFSTICKGPAHRKLAERTNDFYDRDFKQLPFWTFYKHSENPITEKPEFLDTMIEYAEKLAEGIPYARVDFYYVDGHIYFGEITFFTWGGFLKMEPPEWDKKLGDLCILPDKKEA